MSEILGDLDKGVDDSTLAYNWLLTSWTFTNNPWNKLLSGLCTCILIITKKPCLTHQSVIFQQWQVYLLCLTLQYSLIGSFLRKATSRTWLLPKMILPAGILFETNQLHIINFINVIHKISAKFCLLKPRK